MRLATVLLFLLLSVPTSAQSLNNQAIEKWIVAFPEINAFLTQHRGPLKQYISEQYGITGGMETFNKIAPDKIANMTINAIEALQLDGQYRQILSRYNYDDREKPIALTHKIVRIAMAEKMSQESNVLSQQLSTYTQQIELIRRNPQLSSAQKQTMVNQYQKGVDYIKSMLKVAEESDPGDRQVIAPYLDTIIGLLGAG
mgnify:CR=1 FL=1